VPWWVISILTLVVVVVVPKLVAKLFSMLFTQKWDSTGKAIVITGASSGIGEECAKYYAKHGAKLVLSARRMNELERVADECRALGAGKVLCVQTDVSQASDCKNLIQEAAQFLDGVIDLLFLNAGLSMSTAFPDLKEEDMEIFHRLMNVNYFGCIYCTHYALPCLKKSPQGKIAVVSSLAGLGPVNARTGYCASKFALHGFFESLRLDFKTQKLPITVTMICPGYVATNINNTRLGPSIRKFDESKALPVEKAMEIMGRAISISKRTEIFPLMGNIGHYLRFFAPALYDFAAVRAMEHYSENESKASNKRD